MRPTPASSAARRPSASFRMSFTVSLGFAAAPGGAAEPWAERLSEIGMFALFTGRNRMGGGGTDHDPIDKLALAG